MRYTIPAEIDGPGLLFTNVTPLRTFDLLAPQLPFVIVAFAVFIIPFST